MHITPNHYLITIHSADFSNRDFDDSELIKNKEISRKISYIVLE